MQARRATRRVRPKASGLPLGIMPDYAYESAETVLEPGETVVLYTDGVTDAMDANGDRIGDDVAAEGSCSKPGQGRRQPAKTWCR